MQQPLALDRVVRPAAVLLQQATNMNSETKALRDRFDHDQLHLLQHISHVYLIHQVVGMHGTDVGQQVRDAMADVLAGSSREAKHLREHVELPKGDEWFWSLAKIVLPLTEGDFRTLFQSLRDEPVMLDESK